MTALMDQAFEENESSFCKTHTYSSRCLQCSSRQRFPRKYSPSMYSECSALSLSRVHHKLSMYKLTLCLIVLSSCFTISLGATVRKDECDPTDPNSCSFGATCKKEMSTRTPYYRCVCPRINCYEDALYDPVCATDGRGKKDYFNALCLMIDQCAQQKPIKPLCNDRCQTGCKKPSRMKVAYTHCPRKDIGLCMNGGLCVHHRFINESSCRCLKEFSGARCERKELPSIKPRGVNDSDCSKRFEILTIFAVVLLAVLLFAIIIWLCLRYRKPDDKIWPPSEKDERTPLRESARSEFMFPENLSTQQSSEN